MKKLTFFERRALLLMHHHLKYDERGICYRGYHNDTIMAIARVLLGGRDPVKFVYQFLEE